MKFFTTPSSKNVIWILQIVTIEIFELIFLLILHFHGCQFHIRKIRILLIFSWVNDFRKNINKSSIKWFTQSCSWICCSSVFTKKFVLWPKFAVFCFVSLCLPRLTAMIKIEFYLLKSCETSFLWLWLHGVAVFTYYYYHFYHHHHHHHHYCY